MGIGAVLTLGVDFQRSMPLRAPLESNIPRKIVGYVGRDVSLSEAEERVAGVSDYLMRIYASPDSVAGTAGFSVYVGYYEQQSHGKTIHSPKNCLPGAGWEAVGSENAVIPTSAGNVIVNRYLLQRGDARVLVLYWYQGRGRVQANEYRVKWDLLRDSALRGRSDEALVRIVVPILRAEEDAFSLATAVARELVSSVTTSLPS